MSLGDEDPLAFPVCEELRTVNWARRIELLDGEYDYAFRGPGLLFARERFLEGRGGDTYKNGNSSVKGQEARRMANTAMAGLRRGLAELRDTIMLTDSHLREALPPRSGGFDLDEQVFSEVTLFLSAGYQSAITVRDALSLLLNNAGEHQDRYALFPGGAEGGHARFFMALSCDRNAFFGHPMLTDRLKEAKIIGWPGTGGEDYSWVNFSGAGDHRLRVAACMDEGPGYILMMEVDVWLYPEGVGKPTVVTRTVRPMDDMLVVLSTAAGILGRHRTLFASYLDGQVRWSDVIQADAAADGSVST